jgi:tungstate transport system substrate-binding protein
MGKGITMKKFLILIVLTLVFTGFAIAQEKPFITLSTTTSTDNSGLLGYLNPLFTQDTGIDVRVVAKGSGAALELARNGDADIVMVHSRDEEDIFLADGFGTKRYPLMHNDFILLGPPGDPAGIKGLEIIAALKKITESKSPFLSRGDQSGTHVKELALWKEAGITPQGDWYLSIGQGMGKTLTMTSEKQGYTLSDRGTYVSMKTQLQLIIVSEGAPGLLNPYCVIPVNPKRHPHVKAELAQKYADWLLSPKGQKLIADFKVGSEQLFFPDAK